MLEFAIPADDHVITKREAAKISGISECTLDRRIKAGDGPRVVRLSARRVGIRVRDLKVWIEANASPTPTA
jgi:predicted DNA-binding transcriptional regulator AlpA